jgi:hypothetical protein
MSEAYPFVAVFADGSEVLVTEWIDDNGDRTGFTAAKRDDTRQVWGPPIQLEDRGEH